MSLSKNNLWVEAIHPYISIHQALLISPLKKDKMQYCVNPNSRIKKNCSISLASVVRKLDNAINRVDPSTVDSAIGFLNTYPVDNDLSGG